jgi:hypothetical protein
MCLYCIAPERVPNPASVGFHSNWAFWHDAEAPFWQKHLETARFSLGNPIAVDVGKDGTICHEI